MPKKSTIETLPPELKAKVDAMIRAGTYKIDDMVVVIQEAGEDRSRSSVGRYALSKRKTMEIYEEANKMAESLAIRFRDDPESKVSRMLGQVIQGLTFQTAQQMAEDEKAKPNELMLLSATLKNIAGAEKITFEREQRIRKIAKEEAMAEAAAAVTKVQKKAGLSDETAEAIRRQILGLPAKA